MADETTETLHDHVELTVRRMAELHAERQEAITPLRLASLSEQKIAKVIRVLEEPRAENLQLATRQDPEAEDMAQPSGPGAVLDRIKATHEG